MNYKTVASFGNDEILIEDFSRLQKAKVDADVK